MDDPLGLPCRWLSPHVGHFLAPLCSIELSNLLSISGRHVLFAS